MLGNIAFEYLVAGNPGRAAPMIDEMAHVARRRSLVKADQHRGYQWLEQGELARAFAQLERVRLSGESRGFELKLLGDLLIARGELDQARVRIDQYLALNWPPDDSLRVTGLLSHSRREREAGQLERAEADARRGVEICARTRNDWDLAASQVGLAHALIAEHRFEPARAAAETALHAAERVEQAQEWIDARIALAYARHGLQPRDLDAALADARAALDRARERGLVGLAYDARLAAGEIAAQAHRPEAAAQLQALADDADRHGFVLVARKARAVAAVR
jgi:hypothetical protein